MNTNTYPQQPGYRALSFEEQELRALSTQERELVVKYRRLYVERYGNGPIAFAADILRWHSRYENGGAPPEMVVEGVLYGLVNGLHGINDGWPPTGHPLAAYDSRRIRFSPGDQYLLGAVVPMGIIFLLGIASWIFK